MVLGGSPAIWTIALLVLGVLMHWAMISTIVTTDYPNKECLGGEAWILGTISVVAYAAAVILIHWESPLAASAALLASLAADCAMSGFIGTNRNDTAPAVNPDGTQVTSEDGTPIQVRTIVSDGWLMGSMYGSVMIKTILLVFFAYTAGAFDVSEGKKRADLLGKYGPSAKYSSGRREFW